MALPLHLLTCFMNTDQTLLNVSPVHVQILECMVNNSYQTIALTLVEFAPSRKCDFIQRREWRWCY